MAKKQSKKTVDYEEKHNLVNILIGIFLIYSLSSESMGFVGSILQTIFKGFFGELSIIIPVAIILVGVLDFFDANDYVYKIKKSKSYYLILAYVFLFYGLLNKDSLPVGSPFDIQMLMGISEMGVSGEGTGLISSFMGYYIIKAFGNTGAWLVSVGSLIIVLISIFNISVKDFALDIKDKATKKQKLSLKEFFFDFKNNFLDLISEEVNENTIQGNKKSNKKPKKSKPVIEDLDEDQTIKIVGFNKAEDDYLEILEGTSSFNAIDDSTSFRNSEFGEIKRDLEPEKKTEKLELNKLDLEKPPIDKNLEKTYAENISFFDKENIFKDYKFPSTKLLNKLNQKEGSQKKVIQNAETLEKTLADFGVSAKVSQATIGPSITRFEIQPSAGVKVSKIVNLTDDIALSLAAKSIRVEAPIPGKSAIGIEVPNEKSLIVTLREVLESNEFKEFDSKVGVALGKDISGNPVIFDISKMPHLLIAGSTGSGKSVCINTLIASILYKAKPDEVKLLLIDPKVVELANYNGIPHLLIPVVTDPKKASGALNWAVNEMNRRYQLFASNGVKDINSYNEKIETKLPRIVIIIDELADLMMSSANDVEDYICRLAQMARACGMHLIVATQRPSVDVITGVIKANIPSRIAFAVSSQTDSRTILDMGGAEKLLGRGDMLFYPLGSSKPQRIQGAFMSEKESEDVIEFVKSQVSEGITYEEEIIESLSKSIVKEDDDDEFLSDAINFVIESEQASSSMLQRKFKIGFNRAARLIDTMESRGIVGPSEGSKPRKVLIAKEDLESEF